MSNNKIKYRNRGVGLVEIVVTLTILLTVVVGTMGYQYYTALNARQADLSITAGRLALVLLETWKGRQSETDFDPVADLGSDLAVTASASGQPAPNLTDLLGSYTVTANNANYFATLSYQDIADSPRLLNIVVAWGQRDYGQGTFSDTDTSISWTTYQSY
ncbi:MAG: hypothetical protein V3R68_03770 [Gammaproteobacteria bacterium]